MCVSSAERNYIGNYINHATGIEKSAWSEDVSVDTVRLESYGRNRSRRSRLNRSINESTVG
jgi:hypothetical protein